MNNVFSKYWPWYFFAAAFESLLAAAALLLVPSESGLSFARLGLLGILLAFFSMGIYFGWFARRDASRFDKLASATIVPALILFASGLTLFFLRYLDPEKLLPYYERVSPVLWYLFVLALQSLIFFSLVKNGIHSNAFSAHRPVYVSAFFAFGILLSIFTFVAATKIGITPDTAYWGEPGVAILGWQFILSLLIGSLILLYAPRLSRRQSLAENYIFPVFIYFFAVMLWLAVPLDVLRNSFYAPITPPTNIPLPYSDAGFYDYLSQSLLIGTGYLGSIPPRPLYVTFLAALHFFFGQNYAAVIAAQTFVLGLFPVSLYFLGKKLHSPAAGVTAALFAVFRELVGLWISSDARVVNSKIFTTDFPTAMALAFLSLVFIWWLENRSLKSTWISGGFFGLTLLFRTQSLFVLPAIFLLAWFVYQRKTKDWFVAGVVFAIPMLMAVIPWLVHNYTLTDKFTFDDPRQMAVIYSQYGFKGNNDLSLFNPEEDSLYARMFSFMAANPVYVARFMVSHFLNTEIGGLLSLPLIERFDGLYAPVNAYWVAWDGSLAWYNILLLIIYLSIVSVGLGSSWRRARWLGLIPLAINIGYALSNAISRFSSWRYNMPVDWVVYFYFAIGFIEIMAGVFLLFGAQTKKIFPENFQPAPTVFSIRDFRPSYILFALAFMFIGATPWIAKEIASPRYTSTQEQLIARFESSGYDGNEIRAFLSQPEAILTEGRMLYPRMYRRNEGMTSAHPWSAYQVRDYPRMAFILINEKRYDAIFPTKEILDFPQGADATILACQYKNYMEVRAIVFKDKTFFGTSAMKPCIDN